MRKNTADTPEPQARQSNAAKYKAARAVESAARAQAEGLFRSAGLFKTTGGHEVLDASDEALIERNVAAELFVTDVLQSAGFATSTCATIARCRVEMIAEQTGVMPSDPSALLKPSYANALRGIGGVCGLNAGASLQEGPSRSSSAPKARARRRLPGIAAIDPNNEMPLEQLIPICVERAWKLLQQRGGRSDG